MLSLSLVLGYYDFLVDNLWSSSRSLYLIQVVSISLDQSQGTSLKLIRRFYVIFNGKWLGFSFKTYPLLVGMDS